jgi:predicted nucleotidyltransferase
LLGIEYEKQTERDPYLCRKSGKAVLNKSKVLYNKNVIMRLSKTEVQAINEVFISTFKKGIVYLFGSRIDDSKKGGDIDLYIILHDTDNIADKKIDFLVKLKKRIGEQKIDIVISDGVNRYIDIVAKKEGIIICEN